MERAEGLEVPPRLLQRQIASDYFQDIEALLDLLNGVHKNPSAVAKKDTTIPRL
ncbi:MAG TPA: hypothetical protein VJM69_02815 [Dehalococcoidia bacterium]|nr:hypothetical protein [Dehalococcoidia bacterium]